MRELVFVGDSEPLTIDYKAREVTTDLAEQKCRPSRWLTLVTLGAWTMTLGALHRRQALSEQDSSRCSRQTSVTPLFYLSFLISLYPQQTLSFIRTALLTDTHNLLHPPVAKGVIHKQTVATLWSTVCVQRLGNNVCATL